MAKLGDVCTIVSGTTPKSDYPEYWGGDINWVTPAELTDESDTIFESQRKITQQAVSDSSLKPFPAGTVLLSSRAPIGKVAIAGVEMYCNQGFKNLICSDAIYNRYLYHFLKGKTDYLNSLGRGATFKEISKSIVEGIEIPLPSLDEQRRIAAVLDMVSDLIAKRRQQLDKLDELVKARFLEMFGDPVDNNRGWPTQALDSVCKSIVDCPHSTPSYTFVNTGYMCIRTSIVKKNRILWENVEYIPEEEYYQRIQRKKPEKGDIIYTREGAILGIAAMIDRDCNVALGQRSMLLSPDTTKCLPQFLSSAMNFDSFLRKALRGVSGSASPHINVGDIKTFSIIIPPLSLQQQFSDFVVQTEKTKTTISRSLEKLETLKKALMQKYFG